jgi:lysozyme family protein
MRSVSDIINHVLEVEGEKYTNDPADSGGPTKWGWTEKSLRAMGWFGDVRDLDRETAYGLYFRRFVIKSGYQGIFDLDKEIAAELVDTAVNMGESHAGRFLQVALNAFNDGGKHYPDIAEDGVVGRTTVRTLKAFLDHRGADGKVVMLRALNCQQGARYLELSAKYPKNERFAYGWILNRVII